MQKLISVKKATLEYFIYVEIEHSFLGMFKHTETTLTDIKSSPLRPAGSRDCYPENVRTQIYLQLDQLLGQ